MYSAGQFFFVETEKLIEVEVIEFNHEPDIDQVEAGVSMFEKYSDVNSLESLSGGDVTKWNAIKAIPRSEIFIKLLINRDKHKFDKALREIVMRNSKAK